MILPEFKYLKVESAEETCRLLKKYNEEGRSAKLMAGGTDLINFIKTGAIQSDVIIDIKEIEGLDNIALNSQGIEIGALAKLHDIEKSPIVRGDYPALAEAVHLIASTQIRSKGTLAGNICNASPSADSVPALFVLGAVLVVEGTNGKREIPIQEFYTGFKKIDLTPDEMVIAIRIPQTGNDTRAAYVAHTVRKAMDLAIIGVGASITLDAEGICKDAKIALGAVAIHCVRASNAEKFLIGKKLTDEVIAEAGVKAMKDCAPISDVRASAEYRHDMVRVFTKRAIKKAIERF